jgi:hypothetical protein
MIATVDHVEYLWVAPRLVVDDASPAPSLALHETYSTACATIEDWVLDFKARRHFHFPSFPPSRGHFANGTITAFRSSPVLV